MNEKEMAKKNLILKFRTGSHLYGTATENSDEDFVGIFLPNKEYVLGLKNIKEVDAGIKSKDEEGKNTAEAVDCKYYELRNFLKLALENNPNIIELFFANGENIVFSDENGVALSSHRFDLLHKGLYDKFGGYARSQKHKMVIRMNHFDELNAAEKFLSDEPENNILAEYKFRKYPFLEYEENYFRIGDINFIPGYSVKRVLSAVRHRLSNVTNRKDLMTKYGYDTKFASHLIRLLLEGIELLETGTLKFPLNDAKILLEIKNGLWKMPTVLDLADVLENRMKKAYENTDLPEKADFEKINQFCIETLSEFYFPPCFASC